MDVCCSSCMPFGWLCPPSTLLCSLALEAWFYYCLTLLPFFPFFPPFASVWQINLGIFSFLFINVSRYLCVSHAAFVYSYLWTRTHIQCSPSPSFLPFHFSVLSPFLHSSLLPKDKRSGVSTSSGVRGGERSTPVDRGLL